MDFHIFLQARMGSKRFPNKVLKIIDKNKTILDVVNERLSKSNGKVFLLTTTNKQDDCLVNWAKENNIYYFRGSEKNVLDRYYKAGLKFHSQNICRITSDCPLIDYKLINHYFKIFKSNNYDYLSNSITQMMPDGLDVEFFKLTALKNVIQRNDLKIRHKEHVTTFFYENPNLFKIKSIKPNYDHSSISLTVDYEEDIIRIRKLIYLKGGHENIDYTNIKFLFNEKSSKLRQLLFRKKEERNLSYKTQLEKDI